MRKPYKTFLKFVLFAIVLGIASIGALLGYLISELPDPARISERPVPESTKIFDRTGTTLLYEIHGEEKRTIIPFANISEMVKHATVAAEDANFYSHSGIDFRGILRALYIDIRTQNIAQGGSTITQQLVKNTLISKERTLKRKIKEAVLAMLLENRYGKDEILEMYLNQIPYGANAYGIEAAAKTFFAKSARDLTLAESALLASLPKAPSYYFPYGSRKKELLERKDMILDRMKKLGFIFEIEAQKAKAENLIFANPGKNILAPHFVMHVRDYLLKKYDEITIENGGLRIITTLDWDLQQKAETIIREAAETNEKNLQARNAALVAIDPKTGHILAMVGSRDYWEIKNDGNVNVATRPRQPGSAFKPFAYITALAKGYTPETVLFDVPTEFNPLCSPDFMPAAPDVSAEDCYHPKNYDDNFRGPVTVRQSLQQSLNVPSVKILYLAGIEDTIKTAERLGITTLRDRSRFGLSLALGGGEVKLLELVSAYGAFAADGILNPPTPIIKITDAHGFTVEEYQPNPAEVLDANAVRTLNSILVDNEARVPVFARNSPLYFSDRMVAAKTGTTQDNRDAWTLGFTPSLATGVWVGNNDNSEMQKSSAGVMVAAPLWRKFMDRALASSTPEFFKPPEPPATTKAALRGFWQGNEIVRIDKISRKLATEFTPKEYVIEFARGIPHSILYWINKNNPLGPQPSNPFLDAQFKNWEIAMQRWLQTSGLSSYYQPLVLPGSDDIHTEKNKPIIAIAGSEFSIANGRIPLTALAHYPIQSIEAEFIQKNAKIIKHDAINFSVVIPENAKAGNYTVFISVADTYGNNQNFEKEIILRE